MARPARPRIRVPAVAAMPMALRMPRRGPTQQAMQASAPSPRIRPVPLVVVDGSAVMTGFRTVR